MELQSRSSVRDRLLLFWAVLLHLGETSMHMPAETLCVNIAAPSFFACEEMAYTQRLQVMHKVSTCTGMSLLSWCLHGVRTILDASVHVYGRVSDTWFSQCMPKCPDRPYGMQATPAWHAALSYIAYVSLCCYLQLCLLPAAPG